MANKEYRSLLKTLLSGGSPPPLEDYYLHYTAGNDFRNLANSFAEEIIELSENVDVYAPKVLLGDIGIGKTHFFRYLYLLLSQSLSNDKNTLCTWIELRDLRQEEDFQYLFIKGLSYFSNKLPDKTNYFGVLQDIYSRIAEPIVNGKNYSVDQKRVIARQLFDLVVDIGAASSPAPVVTIPGKWVAKYALQKIRQKQDADRQKLARDKAISEEINKHSQIAFQNEFIYRLLDLGEEKSQEPDFDRLIKELTRSAKNNELIDLTLRLCHQAGYKRIVIFIDEMEHIKSYKSSESIDKHSQQSAEILNLFFRLHQNMIDHAGQNNNNSYPSIGQIMAMPDYLLDSVIKKIDPALKDRWDLVRFSLKIIDSSKQTANELIRKILELHQVSGYKLKSNSDVTLRQIKKDLYKYLNEKRIPATMRHMIPTIIKIIQTKWVQKSK
ncbi:MAG: hypothetical protein IT313_08780 [Anaerolineales bacterium]|nr:hypothetical protein [Anaerolineales bacterium]